ncbi:MAG: MerR family transcriptional regulator [Alphaproteobacteria bacterium]|nr:MerR family transcriptional regulator [Alphaproteobacteria bacterium]
MKKSADAFRTISEVAGELDVPQHVLRFWESKFTQIKPLKRAGGRRYYRPEDVALLRGIRGLLYGDGYTIKGVQKVLKERGARFVSSGGAPGAEPVVEKVAVIEPAPVAKAAPKRRNVEPDPDEMPLPFFMPDFLKAPSAAPEQAKMPQTGRFPPAQRKKLEKIVSELTAIRDLLAGD